MLRSATSILDTSSGVLSEVEVSEYDVPCDGTLEAHHSQEQSVCVCAFSKKSVRVLIVGTYRIYNVSTD